MSQESYGDTPGGDVMIVQTELKPKLIETMLLVPCLVKQKGLPIVLVDVCLSGCAR